MTTEDTEPRAVALVPDSQEEWALECRVFDAACDDTLPEYARNLISELWVEIVNRESWFEAALSSEAGQGEAQYTYGHCSEKKAPGGCQLHNLHCGYPDCDRRRAEPAQPKPEPSGDVAALLVEGAMHVTAGATEMEVRLYRALETLAKERDEAITESNKVCDSYAAENQRLSDRIEELGAALASTNKLLETERENFTEQLSRAEALTCELVDLKSELAKAQEENAKHARNWHHWHDRAYREKHEKERLEEQLAKAQAAVPVAWTSLRELDDVSRDITGRMWRDKGEIFAVIPLYAAPPTSNEVTEQSVIVTPSDGLRKALEVAQGWLDPMTPLAVTTQIKAALAEQEKANG